MNVYTGGLFLGGHNEAVKYSIRFISLLHIQAKILGLKQTLKHLHEVHRLGSDTFFSGTNQQLFGVHSIYSQCESTSGFITQFIVLSPLFLITKHSMLPINQKGIKMISKVAILSTPACFVSVTLLACRMIWLVIVKTSNEAFRPCPPSCRFIWKQISFFFSLFLAFYQH